MDAPGSQDWDACRLLLVSIAEEWDQAERDIKLAEQISGKVVLPSIKELRYAGRRLVEIIKLVVEQGDLIEIDTRLRDTRFDCHRARHDAIDAGTAKIAADIDIMAQKLGYAAIIAVFPDFGKLHRELNGIRTQIAESRRDTNNRDKIYQVIENSTFPQIVDTFRELLASEPVIKGLARGERRRQAVVIGVGIVEAIVAAGLLIEGGNWVRSHWPFNSGG